MIRQTIILPEYDDWEIYAYYAVSGYYVDEIMERLWQIGLDSSQAKRAFENLSSGDVDTGLCYSNYAQKRSVMVVGQASSPAEFFNSLTHEVRHLTSHIGNAFGLKDTGEPIAYLSGEISREIYPRICHLLCNCRSNKKEERS